MLELPFIRLQFVVLFFFRKGEDFWGIGRLGLTYLLNLLT